jgi:hypothetical protein
MARERDADQGFMGAVNGVKLVVLTEPAAAHTLWCPVWAGKTGGRRWGRAAELQCGWSRH